MLGLRLARAKLDHRFVELPGRAPQPEREQGHQDDHRQDRRGGDRREQLENAAARQLRPPDEIADRAAILAVEPQRLFAGCRIGGQGKARAGDQVAMLQIAQEGAVEEADADHHRFRTRPLPLRARRPDQHHAHRRGAAAYRHHLRVVHRTLGGQHRRPGAALARVAVEAVIGFAAQAASRVDQALDLRTDGGEAPGRYHGSGGARIDRPVPPVEDEGLVVPVDIVQPDARIVVQPGQIGMCAAGPVGRFVPDGDGLLLEGKPGDAVVDRALGGVDLPLHRHRVAVAGRPEQAASRQRDHGQRDQRHGNENLGAEMPVRLARIQMRPLRVAPHKAG